MILSGFPLISCLFCSFSDGKSCFSVRKSISTSEGCTEHPFAGQNTQQLRHSPKVKQVGLQLDLVNLLVEKIWSRDCLAATDQMKMSNRNTVNPQYTIIMLSPKCVAH